MNCSFFFKFDRKKICYRSIQHAETGNLYSVVAGIDESKPFVTETDTSDFAIAATLNQDGRPVAFFSCGLNHNEFNHSSVEKEAYSIVESIHHWGHYRRGKHFTLITNQDSVRFMFDKTRSSKIENRKINRWFIELGCYNFGIKYRPGGDSVPADFFTRLFCNAVTAENLYKLHDSLCHPRVTRFYHFLKEKIIKNKPHFFRPEEKTLIKATQPFERLSINFKGPLPSATSNKYLLTVIDKYS